MLACLLAPLALTGQGAVNLLYRPVLHKPYRYRMTTNLTQDVGPSGAQTMVMAIDIDTTALSRTGDLTTVRTKVENAKVKAPSNGPLSGSASQLESSMKNETMEMVVDSHFHTSHLKVDGPNQAFAQGMSQAMQSFKFPPKPVRVGETWSSQIDMGSMASNVKTMTMTGKLPVVCKLVSVQNGKAKITMTMRGSYTMAAAKGGMTMKATSETSGYSIVDIATGMMVEVKTTGNSTINFRGQSLKQHIVQSILSR